MEELRQKNLYRGYHLRLGDSQVFYKVSWRGLHSEVSIPYEQLGGVRTSHLRGPSPLRQISGFCLGLSVVLFLLVINPYGALKGQWVNFFLLLLPSVSVLLIVLFYLMRKRYWKIEVLNQNQEVWFYQRKPGRFQVDKFYERLMEARNSYLFQQYATLEDQLSYEEHLNNLKWLRSIQALDQEKYDILYEELKKRTDPRSGRIGFGNDS